ncbi:MAG: radical SAM protein [Deltaproteobacteria bacterium]|jgi:nitrogenase cofactor biosynthesis protein NifB|nr:radical SAM protein [Deltaproteobacteria bacterium]
MGQRLTTITENPCKMCFPLGVVTAFYGLAKSMSLLHGSQGCATYIRRHMATHYNEPIDVAATSLSEEGAVFGGEKNLLKGLANLIKLYDPEIIGVSTTCLAETIGEDLKGSLKSFGENRRDLKAKLIPVSAPGYGGTHFEGYWHGLTAILAGLELDPKPHGGLNVVVGPASPADVRWLKDLLKEALPNHTLFPDISDNLDGAFNPVYERLPQKGTKLSSVVAMAGAAATLELSPFAPEGDSPGEWLRKTHGVKLIRLAPSVGLAATDALLAALRDLGGRIPSGVLEERGRLMDAMADSHKHCALGRAAIFGEPDFVLSLAHLAAENGLPTVLAATGSKRPTFVGEAAKVLAPVARTRALDPPLAVDGADFALIEALCLEKGANVLIGSSEARRLAQKHSLPLVRCAFPIHDRVGGQRVRTMGYDGSTVLLDRLANGLIGLEEESFRERLKSEHFKPRRFATASLQASNLQVSGMAGGQASGLQPSGLRDGGVFHAPQSGDRQAGNFGKWGHTSPSPTPEPDLAPWGLPGRADGAAGVRFAALSDVHPCFSLEAAKGAARLHLPIVSGCDLSCGYCRRDSDCPNESRPGVTSKLLSPEEALERFREVKAALPNLRVVGFAGPGESLSDPEALFGTIELIRREDPRMALCLSSNGLALPYHLVELARLGLRYLTVTVNAATPETAEKIYAWADFYGHRYRGREAAEIILANQTIGIKAAKDLGLAVKVNTVLLKGLNDHEAVAIAKKTAALGADLGNLMPHIPVPGSALGHLEPPDPESLRDLRYARGAYLPQMIHCQQCRADAAGLLGRDITFGQGGHHPAPGPAQNIASPKPTGPQAAGTGAGTLENGFKIAVISKSGVMVDAHFGQAERVHVYRCDGRDLRLLEIREVGGRGPGRSCGCRGRRETAEKPTGFIERLVKDLSDVEAVVAIRIGQSPKELFKKCGIKCFATMDSLERAALWAAKKLIEAQKEQSSADKDTHNFALA